MRYQSFYPFSGGGGSAPRMPFGPPPQSGMFNGPSAGFGRNPGFGPGGGGRRGFGAPGGFGGSGESFGPGAAGGQGQGLSRLENYMRTADKFLTTAQQLSPLISQLSPMVQNIPALLQIYRGFSGTPSAGGRNSTAAQNAARPQPEASAARTDGSSVPRIFQPPI